MTKNQEVAEMHGLLGARIKDLAEVHRVLSTFVADPEWEKEQVPWLAAIQCVEQAIKQLDAASVNLPAYQS